MWAKVQNYWENKKHLKAKFSFDIFEDSEAKQKWRPCSTFSFANLNWNASRNFGLKSQDRFLQNSLNNKKILFLIVNWVHFSSQTFAQ